MICIWMENEWSRYATIESGEGKGYDFSLNIFNIQSETILRELDNLYECVIGG